MQRLIFLVYIVVLGVVTYAQDQQSDSLKAVIAGAREDTNKVKSLLSIASHYYRTDPSVAIQYGTEARDLAEQLEYQNGVAYAYKSIGMGHFFQSDFIGHTYVKRDALPGLDLMVEQSNGFRSCQSQLMKDFLYFSFQFRLNLCSDHG